MNILHIYMHIIYVVWKSFFKQLARNTDFQNDFIQDPPYLNYCNEIKKKSVPPAHYLLNITSKNPRAACCNALSSASYGEGKTEIVGYVLLLCFFFTYIQTIYIFFSKLQDI